jgi:AcrR family transcriptional regulator
MRAHTRQKRSSGTVERVLDAALRVFEETGATQAPVKMLSEYAGISVGSIYHHFDGIGGVAAGLYARCMGALLDCLVESIRGKAGTRAIVRALVGSYLDWTRTQRDAARFIHASAFAPYVARHAGAITATKGPRYAQLMEILHARVKAGEVRALPDYLYEMLIIGPVAELARRWLAGDPGIDLEDARRRLPDRILASICR